MLRVTIAIVLCLAGVVVADDKAPDQLAKGSVWKGQGELADGKVDDRGLRLTDVTVKITDRKAGTLKGELWMDNGARGIAFTGTVAEGSVEFVFGKTLKGNWPKHWAGRKGTVETVKDLLSCTFGGSRKSESPADMEHFKARLQSK